MKSSNFSFLVILPHTLGVCAWPVSKLYVTFLGICAKRWKTGTILANVKTNNMIFQNKAAKKVHAGTNWHQPGSVIQYSPFHWKTFCGFRVRMKRMKKNKHNMKFKPHQEQKKIWAERPQSIFMGNFQFYQDRVRKIVCIAMLCDLKVKFSFCFILILGLLIFHLCLCLHKLHYIKSRFEASRNKYLSNSC